MSYIIPHELKILRKTDIDFKEFVKKLKLKPSTMIFLSEKCYSWLKDTSHYINQPTAKVFKQLISQSNSKSYIETINIESSNCVFLKSVFSCDYTYEYLNGIPKKIIIVLLESEQEDFNYPILTSVIETDELSSPVDCIIDNPSLFDDSIVLLNSKSYERLKKSTNTISNIYNFERLIWLPDYKYPGGDIMLACLNYGSLHLISNMNFPFFYKRFNFTNFPLRIYFIT